MELIPDVEVELEPMGTGAPTAFIKGDGAEGTDGFPEDVRETELLLAELETGTLLLFILFAATWSTEFT